MKNVIVAVVALSSILVMSNANALGKREEGALIGIFGTLILQNAMDSRNNDYVGYPQDAYGRNSGQFPPFRCQGSEVACAYERGVWERKRQEWEDMKRDAYECGRYGRNCE